MNNSNVVPILKAREEKQKKTDEAIKHAKFEASQRNVLAAAAKLDW